MISLQLKAQWHKSCWFKLSKNRLESAKQKRDAEEAGASPSSDDTERKKMKAIQLNQRTFVFTVQKQKAIFMIFQLYMQMQMFNVWLLTYRKLHCWQELSVETC